MEHIESNTVVVPILISYAQDLVADKITPMLWCPRMKEFQFFGKGLEPSFLELRLVHT